MTDRNKRYQIKVPQKALERLERERGAIPISTYITEVLRRYGESENSQ